jgi:hypothetical protein
MKGCRKVLQQWVRKSDNNIETHIQKKTLEFHSIQKEENSILLDKEFHVKEEINSLLQQEALYGCQRAKENWLHYGDQNTKYFHECANQKQPRHQIEMINDEVGQLCETKEDIKAAFIDYYSNIFKAGSELDIEGCLGALDCKVTPEMN